MRRTMKAKAAKADAIDPIKRAALEAAITIHNHRGWASKVEELVKDAEKLEKWLRGTCE